jgi:hypothetical protein
MKIIKSLLIVGLLSVFANAKTDIENEKVLKTIYEQVILKDISNSIKNITELKVAINKKNILTTKKSFSKLVNSWKRVETLYILGDLNDDYIDTPRYIDIFHNGNEDIKEQLDRVVKSKDDVSISLFKNSLKSINALEYILFKYDIKNKRINKIALTITNKIAEHLNEIKNEYIVQEKNFLADLKKANSIFINTIVQSTYKVKEWRLGDVIGATKKYEGKADNARSEYFISKNSANSIEAILDTYKNVFDNSSYEDYGDYLLKLIDDGQVKKLRKAINSTLKLVKNIKNDDFSNTKELYEKISQIHVILFVEIIEDLSINAKILEADGD